MAFPAKLATEGRFVLVLDGYFDESYDADTMVVAGFLARADAWRAFEDSWNAALKAYGLEFWHMTDFAAMVSPYDWEETVRRERLGHVLDLINAHTFHSVGINLPRKLFEGVFSDQARILIGGAYGFAAHLCLLTVSHDLDLIPMETGVKYVFEDGMIGKGDVLKSYDALDFLPGKKPAYHALGLSFEDKRKYVPLQAADILAYELFKYRPKDDAPENQIPRMPLRLLRTETSTWKYFRESGLKAYAAIVNGMVAQAARGA